MTRALGNLIYTDSMVLEVTTCANCGTPFAMLEHMLNERRRTGKDLYCPNGHSLSYRETTEEKLRKQLDSVRARATAEADQRRATERSLRAVRGHNTRLRNAAAAGRCPVDECGRTFDDLHEHMVAEHPDYAEQS